MTATQELNAPERAQEGAPRKSHPPGRLRSLGVPVLLCAVVAACAQIPTLFNRSFYFTDDSAAQFLPMWYHLGQRLLDGQWPLLLDVDAWMGGNLAGEAMFGTWNPVNLACFALVVWVGDLAVAATLVKTIFLVILALGTYLLAREYGAHRGAAFVFAAALPLSGFVLYFQAATWAAGLVSFAWVPHVWWSVRKAALGRCPVLVPFAFGALCLTAGNPYGLMAICVIFTALLIELCVRRGPTWPGVRRLLLTGACVASVAPLVFLPVLGASEVSWRTSGVFNNGRFSPTLNDLLNVSMASHLPEIGAFGSAKLVVPAAYLAWFVLPLVPWLDWRVLGERWRYLVGLCTVGGVYLFLAIGPSNVWLWRWPLRLLTMLFLAAAVLWAVVLSTGLRTDRFRVRAAVSGGILLLGGYLSFSARPSLSAEHLICLAAMASLGVLALRLRGRRWFYGVLQFGTVLMLVLQMAWFPVNGNVSQYNFPTSTSAVRADFAARDGTVAQIADMSKVPPESIEDRSAWQHLLFGNMYPMAGVPSLVAYTGLGYQAMHETLCMDYNGSTCPAAYEALWRPTFPGGPPLADALGVRTVVVQRALIDQPEIPPGWTVGHTGELVTVLHRSAPDKRSAGRLSWTSDGVNVTSDQRSTPRVEEVTFDNQTPAEPAQFVFARLAWPGYSATVNGSAVPVDATPAGLVRVELPADTAAGQLRLVWTPTGYGIGLVCLGTGAGLALLLTAIYFVRTRRVRE